jgi:hypothetical protein
VANSDLMADNIVIDIHGQVKLTGLRQVTHLENDGEYLQSVFSLIGDNVEWAAPEIMAQVFGRLADTFKIHWLNS